MISLMLTLFTIIIATESSASQVAFSELALASNPSVGVGLTTQLVADAFTQLDLDGDQELSVDEMAPVILPLMEVFAGPFVDDSGAYVLQEKFVNHLYVPDLSTITGTVDSSTCAADSLLVNVDSSTLWTQVFGDAAHVEIETFAETVYNIMAEGQVYTLLDLERLMLADLPTEMPPPTLLDEYTVGNENCANSDEDEGRRNLQMWRCLNFMNSGTGRVVRFVLSSVMASLTGCGAETLAGADCTHTLVGVGRAVGIGLGVGVIQDAVPWLVRRFSFIWEAAAEAAGCPPTPPEAEEVPLEPVVVGQPVTNPIARYTPRLEDVRELELRGPIDRLNPSDFTQPLEMEGAPEIGAIATGAGEGVAAGAAEGAAATGLFAAFAEGLGFSMGRR